jgi:succinoglycan biosynthesis protein ExoV
VKLFHYQRPDGVENFGDALNLWLWPQLLPDQLDQEDGCILVGIGTLLNQQLPRRLRGTKRVIIFSTGAGYERPLKTIPEHWQIYCVRGPLSARQLGLAPERAIADGAILLRRFFSPHPAKRYPVGFMPHIHHATFASEEWQTICARLGYSYIDPRWPVERVLEAIGQVEVLLAEAMHGAIAADALRVPWVPIHTSARILNFKWQDWCAAVGVPYCPHYCSPLAIYPPVAQGVRSGLRASHHWLRTTSQWSQGSGHWLGGANAAAVGSRLQQIARRAYPGLSAEGLLQQLSDRLEEQLVQLQKDWAARQST